MQDNNSNHNTSRPTLAPDVYTSEDVVSAIADVMSDAAATIVMWHQIGERLWAHYSPMVRTHEYNHAPGVYPNAKPGDFGYHNPALPVGYYPPLTEHETELRNAWLQCGTLEHDAQRRYDELTVLVRKFTRILPVVAAMRHAPDSDAAWDILGFDSIHFDSEGE